MPTKTGYWQGEEAVKNHVIHDVDMPILLAALFPKNFTLIDLGCGDAYYDFFLRASGYKIMPVDGAGMIRSAYLDIIEADLTQPLMFEKFDGVISLEVGEHIPIEYERAFIQNIVSTCRHRLVLSWAIPGQTGYGHVNERSNDYIISALQWYGFSYLPNVTALARNACGKDRATWFKKSLMVFENDNT